MAKITIDDTSDFIKKAERLERELPEACEDVLRAGAEIIEAEARSNLRGVIGLNVIAPKRSTGTLLSALGISPAKPNKRGHYDIRVGFAEPRTVSPTPNGYIANVLEYGKRKANQDKKPFMRPAVNKTEAAARDAMQAKLDEYVRSLDG